MDRLVDCVLSCLDNLFDRWVTAADNQNNSIRRIDRQRNFFHFQIDAPSAVQQDEMKSGGDLGRLGYPAKVAFRPRAAGPKRVWRFSIEVAHICGEGVVAPVKGAWQRPTKDAEVFLRRINL